MSYKFLGEAVAQSIADAIKSLRSGKVDKVSGKALSTNDYTTEEKNKLAGIAEQANKTTVDTALSSTSTNPVQNKVVNSALSGKLGTSGDSKDNTVTFTSSDTTDANATSWTSVSQLTSGISHATFFNRASQMFKNVRYLYKLLGTTDISGIGNGSVTGALKTIAPLYISTTYTSGLTTLQRVKEAYDAGLIPVGQYFSGRLSTGVMISIAGYLYRSNNALYGNIIAGGNANTCLITIDNDVWTDRYDTLSTAITKLNTDLIELKCKRKIVTATTNASGSVNLTSLTGVYAYGTPVLQVVPRNANANWYAVLTVTEESIVFVTVRKLQDDTLIANTSVNLMMFYASVVTNADA